MAIKFNFLKKFIPTKTLPKIPKEVAQPKRPLRVTTEPTTKYMNSMPMDEFMAQINKEIKALDRWW